MTEPDPLPADEMTADLRRIADTVEQNGGWHIAAVKLRAAADALDRMRRALENIAEHDPNMHARRIACEALSGASSAVETKSNAPVLFYGPEHYVLSNFSAFRVRVLVDDGEGGELLTTFDTSEAAYHWFKFPGEPEIQARIRAAMSAHDAFKLAEKYRDRRRPDWDAVKLDTMRQILRAKVDQHEYVRRKLLETGDRLLIEDSWRDDYWGWGPNRDGQNMLGKLWMEVRAELRGAEPPSDLKADGEPT